MTEDDGPNRPGRLITDVLRSGGRRQRFTLGRRPSFRRGKTVREDHVGNVCSPDVENGLPNDYHVDGVDSSFEFFFFTTTFTHTTRLRGQNPSSRVSNRPRRGTPNSCITTFGLSSDSLERMTSVLDGRDLYSVTRKVRWENP